MKLLIALCELGKRWITVYYIWISQEQKHGDNMYEQKKNSDVKKPKIAPMTINWLRPLRDLLDGDYKQLVQTTLYDEEGQG